MPVDFYESTMSNGYFEQGCGDRLTVFDMFFRNFPMVTDSPSVPTRSSSLTMVKNLHFTKENTDSLRSKKIFHEKISGISGGLSFQRRYLGHAGGNADVPGNRSAADRNHSAPDRELPVLGGRQGQPHRSRRTGNTLWDEVKRFENPHRYFPKPVGTDNMK